MGSRRRHREAVAAVAADSGSGKIADVGMAAIALVIVTFYLSRIDGPFLAHSTLVLVGLLTVFGLTTLICAPRRLANSYQIVRDYWLVFACSGLLAVVGMAWSLMPGAYREPHYILLYPFDFLILLGGALLPLSRLVRHNWRYMLLVPYLILVAAILLSAAGPEATGSSTGRSAGYLEDPNVAAFGIALLCAALIRPQRIDVFNIALLCLSGVAIFVTLSRGGLICFGALLFFYLWTVRISFNPKSLALIGVAIGLGLLGILYGAKPLLEGADLADSRLAMLTLERDPLDDSSAKQRASLIVQTVDRIKEAPILGHGTGATRSDPLGPHNMYLALWAELGLAGILLYVIFLAAGYRLFAQQRFFTGQAVLLVVALNGLFHHDMLEHKEVFVLYGMLISISWYEAMRSRSKARRRLRSSCGPDRGEEISASRRSGRRSGAAPAPGTSSAGETGTPEYRPEIRRPMAAWSNRRGTRPSRSSTPTGAVRIRPRWSRGHLAVARQTRAIDSPNSSANSSSNRSI